MDEKGAVFVNQDTIPGVPEDELDYHQDHSKIIVQEEEDDYQLNDIPMDYGEDGETELTDEEFSFSGGEDAPVHISALPKKTTHPEQVRMIHLRRYLDQLDENVKHQQYTLQRTRDELSKCRECLETLEQSRDEVFSKIPKEEENSNTAAVYRLNSEHQRICQELANEQELEEKIKEQLRKSEYDLAQAEVERGKYLLADQDLKTREDQWQDERTFMAKVRADKEYKYAHDAERLKINAERKQLEARQQLDQRQRQMIEEAERSHEKHERYLQKTISKIRDREEVEKQREKQHMDQRMKTLLTLKSDISANRDNLTAIQARDRAYGKRAQKKEDSICADILSEGGNPSEQRLKDKRIEAFEKQEKIFRVQQKKENIEIVNRIVEEADMIKRRKKQQPNLWTDPRNNKAKNVKAHRKPKLRALDTFKQMSGDYDDEDLSIPIRNLDDFPDAESSVDNRDIGSPTGAMDLSDRIPNSDSEDETPGNELSKPEFDGMWDRHKPYKAVPGVNTKIGTTGPKMQQEILRKVLDKHREGIVIKQVAGGKEFKGHAFYSKPSVIHFKDFDVGKTYKKKVSLTNVSYSVNYCKLTGLTEHLKDFIDIHFDPPGQMSAGLTCEMMVTFSPKINEDLVGEVTFLAQTGPFTIPIQCTTKKCDLHVEQTTIDFGTSVIGETMKRTVTLVNNGAKGTHFDFYKVTGLKQRTLSTADTSLGRLPDAGSFSDSGKTRSTSASVAGDQHNSIEDQCEQDSLSNNSTHSHTTTADTIRGVSPDSDADGAPPKPGHGVKVGQPAGKAAKDAKDTSKVKDTKEATKDTARDEAKQTTEDTAEKTTVTVDGVTDLDTVRHDEEDQDHGDDLTSVPMEQDLEELNSLDGMKVGCLSSGDIGPFSTVRLEIIWQPTIPGCTDTEFVLTFTDEHSHSISVTVLAKAIDVPVWVERDNVDLKICMYDRLYQDTIIVNNRATTALRLKFEVCKELRNHLELLPKTGYIQAQSQFSAQLKFLPRQTLSEEARRYFDPNTGVLEAPMIITVADQTRPVPFTVHAIVTTSDLTFDSSTVDFGHSTIHESVTATVKLTNKSILPQEFGFMTIPSYIDIQPNDGFGTLLPLETIDLDIVFSPAKANEYNFDLVCHSLINREFKLTCHGVGVHPPLQLSHQVVHFAATAVSDVSTCQVNVINNHLSMNEFSHPVPRIGKGAIAPVCSTSYEFMVPLDAPISISPSVATVEPGEKSHVQIRYAPIITDQEIRTEAVAQITRALKQRAQEEYEAALLVEKENEEQAAKQPLKKPDKKKAASPKAGGRSKGEPLSVAARGPAPIHPPTLESIAESSDEYASAHATLLRQYQSSFQSYVIPCYVASGKCKDPGELEYSPHNTLYVHLHCPTVRPPLVVISDNGRNTTDFGEVSIGQSIIKSVTLQNISDTNIDLTSSILDTEGPFQMLNALRMLPPDASHTLLVCFMPHQGKIFQEVLSIRSPTATLHITLKGKGVSPNVTLSVRDGLLDMGAVITGEYREEAFQIVNTSTLAIQYSIKQDSQSLLRHAKSQAIPKYITGKPVSKILVGVQNFNGQNAFDCVPADGTILPGASKDITVTFAPDHQSDYYSDGVRIELFGEEESHIFQVVGQAKPHIMYMCGGDREQPEIESLSVVPVLDDEDDGKTPPNALLATLRSVTQGGELSTATREIYVGCVRTMAVSQKKNGEWSFDSLSAINALGFNIEPVKGMIEAGTLKPITITWTPLPSHDPNRPVETSINCTVRGDVTEQYKIMLRALIVSE